MTRRELKKVQEIAKFALAICVIILCGFMYTKDDGAPKGYKRIYERELVGYYQLKYEYADGTPVFEITTPRGVEKVVGRENLQESLDSYRSWGIYGKPHVEVDDNIGR